MTRRVQKPIVRISSSQSDLRVPRKKLAELVAFVARQEGAAIAEVDIAVVGGEEMASLNRRYLHRSEATDVLSFDLSDATEKGLCAQLVVCAEAAVKHARAQGLRPQWELIRYVVHGLLHLMGYDDETAPASARMHAREDEILSGFRKHTRRK